MHYDLLLMNVRKKLTQAPRIKRFRLYGLALAGLVLLALAVWFALRPAVRPAAVHDIAPQSASVKPDPDVLRYAQGAPQLAALQSQRFSETPLPVTDGLSARLVYDEDHTARVGVGIAGRIVAIHAAPGDSVTAGQVLAEIDSPDLGSAAADVAKARADESRKRSAVERAKQLVPGDAIAVKDFESLQADFAQARAETARAEQRVRNLNPGGAPVSGQRLALTSPVAGVVSERTATPGLEVSPGLAAPLFVVTDPKRLWLMIDVPEQLLPKVKTGGLVEVESDAYPGTRFGAIVAQRGLLVDPNTRRVSVRARLDNPALKLLPEMFVRARLLEAAGVGIRVPNGALVNEGTNAYVYVQRAATEFVRRKVTLLTQGSEFSYVGGGLKNGEAVVTTGALLLDAELAARTESQR